MKMSELYPSRFLKAEDFTEDEKKTMTIKDVVMEELKGDKGKESKPCIYFREVEKGLILNKTNAAVIAEMYGDDTDEWAGKKIVLIAMEVESFGDIVRAIRVKKTKPGEMTAGAHAQSPVEKLTAIRKELSEKFPAKLPAKSTIGDLKDAENVARQIAVHQQILDDAKAEAMP